MLTPETLSQLEKLEAGATAGPWRSEDWTEIFISNEASAIINAGIGTIAHLEVYATNTEQTLANAAFIAAIRNAAKELLKTAINAKKDYDGMREFQMKFIESDHKVIALESKLEKARSALTLLYEETAGYIQLNNLGDVHHNTSMRIARNTLKEIE